MHNRLLENRWGVDYHNPLLESISIYRETDQRMVELINAFSLCYVSLVNGSFFRSLFLPSFLFQPCDKDKKKEACDGEAEYIDRFHHSISPFKNWLWQSIPLIAIDCHNRSIDRWITIDLRNWLPQWWNRSMYPSQALLFSCSLSQGWKRKLGRNKERKN